jgi:hypothetical protein
MEFNYRGHQITLNELPPLDLDGVAFIAVLAPNFRDVVETVVQASEGFVLFVLRADNDPDVILPVAKTKGKKQHPPTVLDLHEVTLTMKPEPVVIVPKQIPDRETVNDVEEMCLFNLLKTDGPPVSTRTGTGKLSGTVFFTYYNNELVILDYSLPSNHFHHMQEKFNELRNKQRRELGDENWEPVPLVPDLEEMEFLRAYKLIVGQADAEDWASLLLKASIEPEVQMHFFDKFNASRQPETRDLL